jgi:hypothetical protein
MKNLIRFAMALVAAHMAAPLWAAAPPGPYFNGFENNTNGWFDGSNGGAGTITRRQSGYSNGSGNYASGIPSASGNWHARLGLTPYPGMCSSGSGDHPIYYGPRTNWGGYSSTFPEGGYKTQLDIYLDVAWAMNHFDRRFDWSSAINQPNGNHRRDFVFNAGTNLLGFVIAGGNNANRCGADPADPGHMPIQITQSGWYTFEHSFTGVSGGPLTVILRVIQKSSGTIMGTWDRSDPSDVIGVTVGGNRYGWFVQNEIPDLAIDNSLRTGLCHSGDGDGDVEERDSHKMHHQHFHKNSTCGGQGGEEDNVNSDDEDSGSHFESNSVQSSTFTADEDSQAVTMLGTGTHDGLPVGFTMIAVDNGNLAPGVFTLILTDGYAFTGDLTSGTIAIH